MSQSAQLRPAVHNTDSKRHWALSDRLHLLHQEFLSCPLVTACQRTPLILTKSLKHLETSETSGSLSVTLSVASRGSCLLWLPVFNTHTHREDPQKLCPGWPLTSMLPAAEGLLWWTNSLKWCFCVYKIKDWAYLMGPAFLHNKSLCLHTWGSSCSSDSSGSTSSSCSSSSSVKLQHENKYSCFHHKHVLSLSNFYCYISYIKIKYFYSEICLRNFVSSWNIFDFLYFLLFKKWPAEFIIHIFIRVSAVVYLCYENKKIMF